MGYTEGARRAVAIPRGEKGGGLYRGGGKGEVALQRGWNVGPQVRGKAVLKSLWKNLERGGIKWKNIPNFVTKRERR